MRKKKLKTKSRKPKYPNESGYFKPGDAVIFDPPGWKVEDYPGHPLSRNQQIYFLTEIPNVPGHCIIVTDEGKVIPMIHPGDLRYPKEGEPHYES